MSNEKTGQPYIAYNVVGSGYCEAVSTTVMSLNEWHHLAAVLNYPNLYFYLDGEQLASTSCTTPEPSDVIRNNSMVGRSNWYPDEEDAYADYDELKIYSRALSYDEISADMNYY